MRNDYHWRDGWALSHPRTIKKQTQAEPITRCLYCGAWTMFNQPCSTCGTERKA